MTKYEWLGTLPEPYRTEALENAKLYSVYDYKMDTVSGALLCSFDWGSSPQGREYWRELYLQLCEQEDSAND
jgi:hypothetical protein